VRQRRQQLPAAAAVHQRAAACLSSVNRARHRCSSATDVAGIRRRRRSPDDAVAVAVGLCRHSLEREQRPWQSHRLRASAFDRRAAQPSSSQASAFDESPTFVTVVVAACHWRRHWSPTLANAEHRHRDLQCTPRGPRRQVAKHLSVAGTRVVAATSVTRVDKTIAVVGSPAEIAVRSYTPDRAERDAEHSLDR